MLGKGLLVSLIGADRARRVGNALRTIVAARESPRIVTDKPSQLAAGAAYQRYRRREGFIIVDLVQDMLAPDDRFIILDGGAREAWTDPRWQAFVSGRVRLYGFEPDAAEVERLNKEAAARKLDYRYYPAGLWSRSGKAVFIANKSPGGGSFFEQNVSLTDRWRFESPQAHFLARDIFYPTAREEMAVTSVDDWARQANVTDLDFMKLNVQGCELEILQGSTSLLDRVLGLMVEMSFAETYHNRPFFSDIDAFLRSQDFAFFDFIGRHYIGRARSPIIVRHLPGMESSGLYGHLFEGHGIYFRDPIDMQARGRDIAAFTTSKLLKLVCFAEMFGQVEYAFELLLWHADRLDERGDAVGAASIRALADRAESTYRRVMGTA
jgi:FkbM family methyltransferase